MSSSLFMPGQRWISNTESELGLGIVVEAANRRVDISFPAAGERRTYAVDNAPISRVRYDPGQVIIDEDQQQITVEEVIDNNGCLIYKGIREGGESVILAELELSSFVQFNKPQDRLFAGQIDKNRAFQLRCQTLEHIRHQQQSPVRGLLGPRVQLLPHQLYIASEAASRYAPRVLLADEVGLGKTIEAGLILHQQLISGRAKRVLIVVPDSLLHQWLVEMLRRFNLHFTILDEERCQGLAEFSPDQEDAFMEEGASAATSNGEAYNPFESAQLVLCTLSFLQNNPSRQAQALEASWDLLIVDEAHHLQWSEQQPSSAYRVIEALAEKARGLLLLTATPEQLGVESHFARLRLLDPDRYYDLTRFIEEEKNHQPVNLLVQELLEEDVSARIQQRPELLIELRQYLGEETVDSLIADLAGGDEGGQQALDSIISQLLDRHGTGRVLFRNTRSSVEGFPQRLLQQYALAMPDRFQTLQQQATVDQLLTPELLLGDSWIVEDSRVAWLLEKLKELRTQKVLVICARADTALQLEEHLRLRGGVHSAVFHEGLSLVARDRAAAYFADDEEGAQLLVCSEIGSEGRNFQFSHHLVLFDLPLNPDLLEQRIGRLDRIGQRHSVEIHVPYYLGSAQEVLLRWYHQGINAFESTCPAGLVLYKQFEERLHSCLLSCDQQPLQQLIDDTEQTTATLLHELQQGRDRLLELNSCNHEQAKTIVSNMVEEERRQELSSYMNQVFDQFGVEQEHHSAANVVLRPSDHMVGHSFPALPDDGVTVTFSREQALSREDMQYLSWEHPMVSGAMDMVLSGEFGNTAFCTLKIPPLKAGTVLLEAIFIVQSTAPESLQLHRHLPLTPVRIVVDNNHTNLSQILTPAHLDKLGQKVAKRIAQDLVRHARSDITAMVASAEKLAQQSKALIIDEAAQRMQLEQSSELMRLTALGKLNPNIRQEEIEYLRQSAELAEEYLRSAQLKLDAVRVALVIE